MVEIISIGSELVLGDINDTNSQYIAARLTENGYKISKINVVADNLKDIINVIKDSLSRSHLIIITGGLGPTEDDLTRTAAAKAMGLNLIKKDNLVNHIKQLFKEKGYTLTENNFRQAYLPDGAEIIKNEWGTAPGFKIISKNKTLISLPGVPYEMKNMFEKYVLPQLNNDIIIKTRILHVLGIGESLLEDKIDDIIYNTENPRISLLAQKQGIDIRITANGRNIDEIHNIIIKKEKEIRERINEYIYGSDEENLPELVGNLLKIKKKTLSTAESCTGGLIGSQITKIPGSSNYFMGGLIVYSNKAKINQLNIKPETINKYGAVSSQTAVEMAQNSRNIFSTDYAISVTGIAGPGGGSKEKPVGLVYIGLCCGENCSVYKLNLPGNRGRIRWLTSQYALFYLHQKLKEEKNEKD